MKKDQDRSIIDQFNAYLKHNPCSGCLLIADPHSFDSHGSKILKSLNKQNINGCHYITPKGESAKTLSSAEKCWQVMYDNNFDRRCLVIGMGGGSVTDLSGFVASCYMRGVDSIYIPTTLLCMVDASIGGKTAINLSGSKNVIGTFYKPKASLASAEFLTTLPEREFRSGLAEIIKAAVIADPHLFDYLENHMETILVKASTPLSHIIDRARQIKNDIVERDFKDNGERALLNYGHTFGHAIETMTNFNTYSHGEAVSIGMTCAANASHLMGMVDSSFISKQQHLCNLAGLPTRLPTTIDAQMLLKLMRRDKKNVSGNMTLILPQAIGKTIKQSDVPDHIILSAIKNTCETSHE